MVGRCRINERWYDLCASHCSRPGRRRVPPAGGPCRSGARRGTAGRAGEGAGRPAARADPRRAAPQRPGRVPVRADRAVRRPAVAAVAPHDQARRGRTRLRRAPPQVGVLLRARRRPGGADHMAELTGAPHEIQLNDPQTLYRRWEDGQWSPFAVDLARDRDQWPGLDDGQRGLLAFALSSLMVAEERITTKFSGLVSAHGSEEEATFLATQQVDEARHMQFYARFRDEVIAEPRLIAHHVERARAHVSDAFRELFDGVLVRLHEELVANPGDLAAKVRFVTLYHLVLESTLGLTTFRFVTGYLEENRLLPGFVEGYSKIHHDETRHIGYGVWFLRETVREHPEQADPVRETLRELLPAVAESLKLPGNGDASSVLGVSEDDLRQFALSGLTRRLSIIGVPLETVFG